MLKTVRWVSFGWVFGLLVGGGCSDDSKTKSEGESVASCDCPVDWTLDNTALCVAPHTSYSPPVIFSSYLDDGGNVTCPATQRFPQPVSREPWSPQHISSRCTGKGTLTLRVRAGTAKDARADDCILAEQTSEFDYTQRNRTLELPPVPAWSARDEACSRAFEDSGGYVEFRMLSDKLGCGAEDEKVNYIDICLAACQDDPMRAGCEACSDTPDQNRL
jgi:hypothetical protein